jgi:hypothetical protein
VISVRRPLIDPAGGEVLPVGSYIIYAERDENGDPKETLFASGVMADTEETLTGIELPTSYAALFNPDTHDIGEVAITGCRLWRICLFWESRC